MRNSFSLHGVIVPLVTPFDEQNQVDHPGVRRVVDFVIAKGVHAVMVAGTTGEGPLLSLAERKQVLETVVAQTNGRVPVIAHTGCIDTGSTVELSKHAQQAGAAERRAGCDALLTVGRAAGQRNRGEERRCSQSFIHGPYPSSVSLQKTCAPRGLARKDADSYLNSERPI